MNTLGRKMEEFEDKGDFEPVTAPQTRIQSFVSAEWRDLTEIEVVVVVNMRNVTSTS